MVQKAARQRRFSDEDVGEIIVLASRLDSAAHTDDGLDAGDVRRIAEELGIDPAAVAEAIARHAGRRRRGRRRHLTRRLSRLVLSVHTLLYGTSMVGLAAIDLAEGGGFDFLHYPLFGWGVVLAWHVGLTWLFRRSGR